MSSPAPSQSPRASARSLTALLLAVGVAYLINYNGISSSNDGSQFALLRAIVERGQFQLGRYHERYTLGVDYAVSPRDGEVYSDRPPGTAFLLTPVYAPFYWTARLAGWFPSEDAMRFAACFAHLLIATANVGLVYWVSRLLGAGRAAALGAAAVFAFTGFNLKYSTLIFSHPASAAVMLLNMSFLLRPAPRRAWLFYPLAGATLGYGVLIEYQNAVPAAFFFLVWAVRLWRAGDVRSIVLIAAGGATAGAALAGYHWVCFGRLLSSTHSYNPEMPHNESLAAIFSGNLIEGLGAILWRPPTGLLTYSPVILFGAAGLVMAARGRTLVAAFVALAVLHTLLLAKHVTIIGGGTQDCRYIFPVTAMLAPGVALFLEWTKTLGSRVARWSVAALFTATVLFSFSGSMAKNFELKIIDLDPETPGWERVLIRYATVGAPVHNVDLRYFELFEVPRLMERMERQWLPPSSIAPPS